MIPLLDRIIELAGTEVAATICAEFAGLQTYIPCPQQRPKPRPHAMQPEAVACQSRPPLCLVLHVDVHPQAPLGPVSAAIEQAVRDMRVFGLHAREIGVQPHGLGDALIDALRSDAALGVPVAPIPAR